MKKYMTWTLLIIFVTTAMFFSVTRKACAQLVLVNEKFKVVKLDIPKGRLEVRQLIDEKNKTITYVLVDGNTKCSVDGRAADWKDIKPGTIIRVKGGMRLDMKIQAKKIYW
ncbi:MAG: hypothetical protein M1269_11450 [Chloroflexi bacterium]|nr:hypothetical protein [Chloroflexota bacterium]